MTHKFPDAEAIEAAAVEVLGQDYQDDLAHIEDVLKCALDSYRTRTGIDLADVSEKLASGEWVLESKQRLKHLEQCSEYIIDSSNTQHGYLTEYLNMALANAKQAAMIRAAK